MKETNWKLFRELLSIVRERYLGCKNQLLVDLLRNTDKPESERFWGAWELIDTERKSLRRCFDHISRSRMEMQMALMLRMGMIQESDLGEFSDELREKMLVLEAL